MAYILPSLLFCDDFDISSFHLLTMFLQSLDSFATLTSARAPGFNPCRRVMVKNIAAWLAFAWGKTRGTTASA